MENHLLRSQTLSPRKNYLDEPNSQYPTNELDRMRGLLLAEIMSLQLLHSVFDLKIRMGQSEKRNDDNKKRGHNTDSGIEQRPDSVKSTDDGNSSATPSGYESMSHSPSTCEIDSRRHTDISTDDKCSEEKMSSEILNETDMFDFQNKNSNNMPDTPLLTKLREPYSPRKGGLLEELIEAQLTGTPLSTVSMATRLSSLKTEISTYKKAIDSEVLSLGQNALGDSADLKSPGR